MSNRVVEKYLRAALESCPPAYKRKMKTCLYESLCDYVEENPTANESELAFFFGKPEQYSADYIESLEDEEKDRLLSKSKFIKRAVTVGVASIILIITIVAGIVTYAVLDSEEEYYYYDVISQEF